MLSKLWRQLLDKRGIGVSAAEHLMQRYLEEEAKRHAQRGINKPFDRSSERSNLCTHLSSPDMTLKSFHKALKFSRAVKVKHTIEAEWPNGSVEQVSVTLELSELNDDDNHTEPSFGVENESVSDE